MAIDPRKLRPADVVRLVNSTPLGEVLSERQLHRHRERAGLRIGDEKKIDLIRYIAWLADRRHNPEAKAEAQDYGAKKERSRKRESDMSLSGRDIGPIPECVNPERREACSKSLVLHAKTYHARTFYLPWYSDLIEAAEIIQSVILNGGLFALAMTRGGGKTALARVSVEWALLNGYRRFPIFIAATDPLGTKSMRALKTNLANNPWLLGDYPEVCFPIHKLGGINNRAAGQLCEGRPTNIKWTDDEIRLPDIIGSKAAGSVCWSRGLLGAIRGANEQTASGESLRPDFLLPDDVQTRESAKSPQQTNDRELTVQGDLVELAGPDTAIAGVMLCTVIYPGDLSSRFLDRERNPDWQGKRYQAVYGFPTNTALWEEYAAVRGESLRAGGRGIQATEFYEKHREEMDAGAKLAWPARVKKGDLSALQTAMNVKISKPRTFAAEWQNEPEVLDVNLSESRQLTEDALAKKLDENRPRGTVRSGCNRVTAFIDVQQEVLFWKTCAWSDRFGGGSVDYGTYPVQPVQVFNAANPPTKLSDVFRGMELNARIIAGLQELVGRLFKLDWKKEDAAASLPISICLIDAGFKADAVHEFIRLSPLKALLRASMGKGIGPHKKPMNEYSKGPGDRMGWNWRVDAKPGGYGQFISFDANAWKSAVADAILDPPGSASSFHFFGKRIYEHPLLTTHLLAEHRTPTWGLGRRVEVWTMRPGETENHWFDGLVGCAVGASYLGIQYSAATSAGMPEVEPAAKPKVDARAEYERKRREFEARRGMR